MSSLVCCRVSHSLLDAVDAYEGSVCPETKLAKQKRTLTIERRKIMYNIVYFHLFYINIKQIPFPSFLELGFLGEPVPQRCLRLDRTSSPYCHPHSLQVKFQVMQVYRYPGCNRIKLTK
jgi:hypothetical protein